MIEKMTYSVTEAAKILGIGRNLAYQLVETGQLHAVKLGEKRLVIPKTAINDMLNRNIH